jgi:hypothetical protein
MGRAVTAMGWPMEALSGPGVAARTVGVGIDRATGRQEGCCPAAPLSQPPSPSATAPSNAPLVMIAHSEQ